MEDPETGFAFIDDTRRQFTFADPSRLYRLIERVGPDSRDYEIERKVLEAIVLYISQLDRAQPARLAVRDNRERMINVLLDTVVNSIKNGEQFRIMLSAARVLRGIRTFDRPSKFLAVIEKLIEDIIRARNPAADEKLIQLRDEVKVLRRKAADNFAEVAAEAERRVAERFEVQNAENNGRLAKLENLFQQFAARMQPGPALVAVAAPDDEPAELIGNIPAAPPPPPPHSPAFFAPVREPMPLRHVEQPEQREQQPLTLHQQLELRMLARREAIMPREEEEQANVGLRQ